MNWEIRLYTIISSLQENEGFKLHMNQGHLETLVPNMEVWGELGVCVCGQCPTDIFKIIN